MQLLLGTRPVYGCCPQTPAMSACLLNEQPRLWVSLCRELSPAALWQISACGGSGKLYTERE